MAAAVAAASAAVAAAAVIDRPRPIALPFILGPTVGGAGTAPPNPLRKATPMTPRYLHAPPPASTRARCPVCRGPVYSNSGIHPQCAIRQSDPPKPRPIPKPKPAPDPPAVLP